MQLGRFGWASAAVLGLSRHLTHHQDLLQGLLHVFVHLTLQTHGGGQRWRALTRPSVRPSVSPGQRRADASCRRRRSRGAASSSPARDSGQVKGGADVGAVRVGLVLQRAGTAAV